MANQLCPTCSTMQHTSEFETKSVCDECTCRNCGHEIGPAGFDEKYCTGACYREAAQDAAEARYDAMRDR